MCACVEKQQQKMDVLRLYKCLRSSDPFYVSYYIKWVKTSWHTVESYNIDLLNTSL